MVNTELVSYFLKKCANSTNNELRTNDFNKEVSITQKTKLKKQLMYHVGQFNYQRWSRGHKARGQGHKKNPRPRTAFPRTDTLEAKDRNARGQGQGPRTQAQVLSKTKKKGLHKNFSGDLQKKRPSQKFFRRSPQKYVFQKIFQALHKILTIQKLVLSSSRGQANFRGLEASRPRPRTWPSRPRPRTSKCVLEDSTSVNYSSRYLAL